MSDVVSKQLEMLIALVAQATIGRDEIRRIALLGKKKPQQWLKGYNACDGKRGVTEIAKIAGVSQPNATNVLKTWERQSIVFNVGTEKKPLFRRLMLIQ